MQLTLVSALFAALAIFAKASPRFEPTCPPESLYIGGQGCVSLEEATEYVAKEVSEDVANCLACGSYRCKTSQDCSHGCACNTATHRCFLWR